MFIKLPAEGVAHVVTYYTFVANKPIVFHMQSVVLLALIPVVPPKPS